MAAGWFGGLLLTMRFKVSLVTIPWTAAMAVFASSIYGSTDVLLGGPEWLRGPLVVVASYLGVTAGYAVNDHYDYDVDRTHVMRTDKAASHGVDRRYLLSYAAALGVPSLLIMMLLSPLMLVVGVAQLLCILGYSVRAKASTPWANVLVVIPTGLMPLGVFFAYTSELTTSALVLMAVNLAFEPGFTWAGVARDVEFDSRRGVPTLPARHGVRAVAYLVLASWTATLALTVVMSLTTPVGIVFMAGALFAAVWLVAAAVRFLRNPTPEIGGSTFLRGVLWFWVFSLALILDVVFFVAPPW
jgi:4-hydroxybenzoate polyprenyltransferase